MRVANIIEEGKVGGPQIRMVRVAKALSVSVETLIVMPRVNSGAFRELCSTNNVAFFTLPITRITKEWRTLVAYVLLSPFEVLWLAYWIRKQRIDLVHASGGSWQYKAIMAAWIAGKPSIWHLNDTSMPLWVRNIFRLLQPMASAFIYASKSSQKYYSDLIRPGRPQSIVPSTVDLNYFSPYLDHPQVSEIAIGSAELVIGTVANVSPVKGIDVLIRAAVHLRSLGFSPHVVIVGPVFERQSDYLSQLLQLAEEKGLQNIHFVGASSDVRPYLARFNAYVCSSIAESSPISVWEAMAMGCPVVSTDVGDVSQHIESGRSGFVVRVNDHIEMAERIAELLGNAELRSFIGNNARQAAAPFSPDLVAKQTLDAYNRTLLSYAQSS
ncbi:MAG: glycosyltransferase family 4 protein [Halieaceae bacterium]